MLGPVGVGALVHHEGRNTLAFRGKTAHGWKSLIYSMLPFPRFQRFPLIAFGVFHILRALNYLGCIFAESVILTPSLKLDFIYCGSLHLNNLITKKRL